MDQLDPDAVPVPRLEVRTRTVRGVMHVALGDVALELSDSARFIWKKVDGRRTVGDIGRLLAAEYGIDAGEAVADTGEVLLGLAEQSFVDVPGRA
ncbi:PqqD family protein [Dactylosporangium sp. NPDC051541]|uniref:PqqD family protein n=1 Tax=Dactylosporangium sp. NPDC051541 TaxID=3363977 RepID=UPI0037BAE952